MFNPRDNERREVARRSRNFFFTVVGVVNRCRGRTTPAARKRSCGADDVSLNPREIRRCRNLASAQPKIAGVSLPAFLSPQLARTFSSRDARRDARAPLRVNLDADAARRVTVLANFDKEGAPVPTIDGITRHPGRSGRCSRRKATAAPRAAYARQRPTTPRRWRTFWRHGPRRLRRRPGRCRRRRQHPRATARSSAGRRQTESTTK